MLGFGSMGWKLSEFRCMIIPSPHFRVTRQISVSSCTWAGGVGPISDNLEMEAAFDKLWQWKMGLC